MRKKLFVIAVCVLLVAVVGCLTACDNKETESVDYRAEFDKLWAEKTATVEETEKQPYADEVLEAIWASFDYHGMNGTPMETVVSCKLEAIPIDRALDESADLLAVYEFVVVFGHETSEYASYDYGYSTRQGTAMVVKQGITLDENKKRVPNIMIEVYQPKETTTSRYSVVWHKFT